MLTIRVAEVDVIRIDLGILRNNSLEYIPSKKSATSSSWLFFRRSALKSPSSPTLFSLDISSKSTGRTWLLNSEFYWEMMVNEPYHIV